MNVWNELTTDATVYGGVGTLLPLLVAVINRPSFPSWLKQTVMVACSIAVGIVTYGVQYGWDFTDPAHIVLAVLGVATATQLAYRGLWSKGVAPAIEANILGGKKPDPAPVANDDASGNADEKTKPINPAGPARKLGRLAPTGAPRVKLTADLIPADAFTPPASVDWYTKVPASSWGMDGNDNAGDCTCAEVDHSTKARQVAAGNPEVKSTAAEVLALYTAITGYNPNDPSTDQGAVMQDVRDYWHKHGVTLGGKLDKLTLFAAVDHTDLNLVRWCVDRFGAVALGINFPDTAMDQFDAGKPWDVVSGARIEGGHAISMVGYDSTYAYVVTWGKVQPMTWAFFSRYVEEAWTDISADWINSVSGQDPLGEVAYALGQQFEEVTGQANPFPAPQPSPTPTPDPAPTPQPVPDPTPTPDPAAVQVSAGLAKDVTLWARRVIARKDDSHQDKTVAQEWLTEVTG